MKLEIEGKLPIINPTQKDIKKHLLTLKSYGRASYASITKSTGEYLQVAGGGVSCLLESFEPKSNCRLRCYHSKLNRVCPDGTLLVFSAGEIAMKSDEWLSIDEVINAFIAFMDEKEFPPELMWREMSIVPL